MAVAAFTLVIAVTASFSQAQRTGSDCAPLSQLSNRHPALALLAQAQGARRQPERQKFARSAVSLLDQNSARDSVNAWAYFARGIAARIRQEVDLFAGGTDQIVESLLRAIELDPANHEAVCQVVTELDNVIDTAKIARGLGRIEKARTRQPSDALNRAYAQLAVRLGRTASVIDDELLVHSPDVRVALARAEAMLRTSSREQDGYTLYIRVVERAAPIDLERIYDHVRDLVNDTEALRWKKGSLNERREFLKSFWDVHAARVGLRAEERAAEHYRRVAAANIAFLPVRSWYPPSLFQLTWFDTIQPTPRDVYLRYGAPDRILRSLSGEAWLYSSVGVPRSFGFSKEGVTAFLAPPDCQLVDLLAPFDRRYGSLAIACGLESLTREQRDLRQYRLTELALETGREYKRAMATDAYQPFKTDLPFISQSYSFAQDSTKAGTTLVTTAFGLPLSQWAGHNSVELQASVILMDTASNRIIRRDTVVRAHLPTQFAADALLQFYIDVLAPPGNYESRTTVRDGATQVGRVTGSSKVIPRFSTDNLVLSDLVLTHTDGSGSWRRNGISLKPSLEGVLGEFGLYYEVYGLRPGLPYTTSVRVTEKPSAKESADRMPTLMQLTFEEQPMESIGMLRTISHQLKAGEYRLVIQVVQGRRSAQRDAALVVSKPAGGD